MQEIYLWSYYVLQKNLLRSPIRGTFLPKLRCEYWLLYWVESSKVPFCWLVNLIMTYSTKPSFQILFCRFELQMFPDYDSEDLFLVFELA